MCTHVKTKGLRRIKWADFNVNCHRLSHANRLKIENLPQHLHFSKTSPMDSLPSFCHQVEKLQSVQN